MRPDQAKEMQRMEGETEELSAADVTYLLGGGVGDVGDEDEDQDE